MNEKYKLPRSETPEEVGVSSKDIDSFINELEWQGVETHSVMIIRHGEVAFETWREPYSSDIAHTMYSVSKSIVSIAAGMAIEEGIVSLDTKLLDVFPEYRKKEYDEYDESITLKTLLSMTAGREESLLVDRANKHWIKDFFDSKKIFKPGEGWKYISENTYCVSAMLNRLIGTDLTTYLTPRLYEPLGIDVPQWERDFTGVEVGGWGLFLKTEDLAKIALCCLNGGKLNGRQIIPEWYVKEATSMQVDNYPNGSADSSAGYGYCFWRCAGCKEVYRFDGMFSQFAFVFEEHDAIVVLTSNEINEQKVIDIVWGSFPAAFFDGDAPEHVEITAFKPLKDQQESERSPVEKKLRGKTVRFLPNLLPDSIGYPLSILSFAAVYMSADKLGPFNNVKFSFYEDEMTMYWTEGKDSNIIHLGLDGKARLSKIKLGGLKYTTCSTAQWLADDTLEMWIRPLETVGQRRLRFTFKGRYVSLVPSVMPTLRSMTQELSYAVDDLFSAEILRTTVKKAFNNVDRLIETTYRGRII